MTYREWYEEHAQKHSAIMKKLEGLDKEEVVEYFMFDNMVKKEPDFCRLYAQNRKCHDMEELNCYLCGCPNFRFYQSPRQEEHLQIHSVCSIDSKDGKRFYAETKVHQDCSGCTIPHTKAYVLRHFDRKWTNMMQKVEN